MKDKPYKNQILIGNGRKEILKHMLDEWEEIIGLIMIYAKDGRLRGVFTFEEK